ncbi:TonB-dependent receptor [Pedobacter frigoris]|uniref:TonB-dependent receptor n=1 Tax=Pedobacter frigoris TaxID=2571272 RepID=A0A4U1CIB4_9SPHI|nr:TonB-dependent receptor [Pedobacter frigoris]TKC07133.1 TonB-dependent receptor [Pedobacter frigoris]
MKLTIFLLAVSLTHVFATGYAQNVTIDKKNAELGAVLQDIQQQTGYNFLYNSKMIRKANRVDATFKGMELERALKIIFDDQPLTFVIDRKTVIVKMKPEQTARDLITVSGKVFDENKTGMAGVTIKVQGLPTGAVSSADGSYAVKVQDDGALVFSYTGYTSQTIKVDKRTTIDVTMVPDPQLLEQVVVIGYGTQRRSSVVGAIDQIKSSQIENRPVGNVTQALQGTSPSIVIQQRSMNPNDNSLNINLRGVSTMGNNSPLLVIDGVISESINDMNNLNPNDIESVSVLKDAGSSAIYGSRSANGVLLITTKKGKKGMDPVVRLSGILGSQNPEVLVKPLKGYQNALLRNDSYFNVGANPIYSAAQIEQFATGDSEYFLKGILKDAFQQNYNVSVQGGAEKSTYMVSLGYYDQESNYKGPDFGLKRYNLRSNLTTDIGRLKLSTILWYDRSEGKAYQGDNGFLIADASRIPVYNTYRLKGDDGKYYVNDVLTQGNPLANLERGGYTNTNNDHFQGSLNAELNIIDGLKAKGLLGLDLRPENRLIRRFYWPTYNEADLTTPTNASSSNAYSIEDYQGKSTLLNMQAILDYNKTFGGVHNVTLLAGYSNESYRRRAFELKRSLVDPILGVPIEGTIIDEAGSYNTIGGTVERSLNSYFGRAGYNFADKYFIEGSFRYDGSSKFDADNRWGFFPSVSAGWRLSEESFFSFWKEKVGDVKIRGSYGQLGNQNVDDYQTYTTYTIYQNQYGFNNSAVPGTGYTLGNPLLQWETANSFNIGADATFLKGSLTAAFDYFHKTTNDILLLPPSPLTLGGGVPKQNIGSMVNQGWELTVNYGLKHGDFSHNFGLNVGDSWNKVTKLVNNEQIDRSDEIERIMRVGLPLYAYYGYKTDGLFQNEDEIKDAALPIGVLPQPGDVRYKDRDNDGIITDNDRYVLGHAFPRLTFGFNYDVRWKGFDMNMLWQGVGKRDMAVRGETIEPFHGGYSFVMFEHQLDYWTPANPDARWPRLTPPSVASTVNNYGKGSDFNILNAAYLRLKNIQVGYTLPNRISNKIGMRKLRVFLNGQNMLTFSKHSFIDPESSEFGSSMNAAGANSGRNYPLLKYVGGGFDIEF